MNLKYSSDINQANLSSYESQDAVKGAYCNSHILSSISEVINDLVMHPDPDVGPVESAVQQPVTVVNVSQAKPARPILKGMPNF